MKKIDMKWVIKDSDCGRFFHIQFLKFPKELRGSGTLGIYQKGKQTIHLRSNSFPEIACNVNNTIYEIFLVGTQGRNETSRVSIEHKQIVTEALKSITKPAINVTRRRV